MRTPNIKVDSNQRVDDDGKNDDFLEFMDQFNRTYKMPSRGEIVSGEVTGETRDGYFVDIGQKSDSFVSKRDADELETGERLDFQITSHADEDGSFNLSLKRARSWAQLQELRSSNRVTCASVESVAVSGSGHQAGLLVRVLGLRGFIPRSQIHPSGNLEDLIDQDVPVMILKVDPEPGRHGNLVLSQKHAIEDWTEPGLDQLQIGDRYRVTVRKLFKAGALVIAETGHTGLIPRTELVYERNVDPATVLSVGEKVAVRLIRVDTSSRRIFFSLRETLQEDYLSTLGKGDIVSGTISRIETYGAFVHIGGCIDGLLHWSEVRRLNQRTQGGSRKVREPLAASQKIEVAVKDIDRKNRRISLTRLFDCDRTEVVS